MTAPTQHRAVTAPDRRQLMGLPLDPMTQDEVIERVIGDLAQGRGGGVLLTAHLDALRQYQVDPRFRTAFDSAELVLADGMPLVWASRLQGTPLPERVAGSTMI